MNVFLSHVLQGSRNWLIRYVTVCPETRSVKLTNMAVAVRHSVVYFVTFVAHTFIFGGVSFNPLPSAEYWENQEIYGRQYSPDNLPCACHVKAGLPEWISARPSRVPADQATTLYRVSFGGGDHITPVLGTLHRLPVKYRMPFKLLILTYKARQSLLRCCPHIVEQNYTFSLPGSLGWCLQETTEDIFVHSSFLD